MEHTRLCIDGEIKTLAAGQEMIQPNATYTQTHDGLSTQSPAFERCTPALGGAFATVHFG